MANHAPGCRAAMLQPSMDCPDCMAQPEAQPCATCNPGAICSCQPSGTAEAIARVRTDRLAAQEVERMREDLRDTRNDLVICKEVLTKAQRERAAARARVDELLQEQDRRWDCRAPEYGPPCGACTSCLIRGREALESEVQKLRLRLDCGKMGDEACGDCGKCWQLTALRTGVDLLDARHVLSRLVTTIRWVSESRPDVAAALEINLVWIRAVELLEARCPEKEAPCSPET